MASLALVRGLAGGWLCLLTACAITPSGPPAAAAVPEIVLGLASDGEATGNLPELQQALEEALASRGMRILRTWEAEPGAPKATAGRLARLREVAAEAGSPQLILIEVRPTFYAQLDGRYRWTVSVEVRAGASAEGGQVQEDRASLPVFLRFDHEREDAALKAAGPELVRVAMRALDAYLSSQ